jgi:hypothetical protein
MGIGTLFKRVVDKVVPPPDDCKPVAELRKLLVDYLALGKPSYDSLVIKAKIEYDELDKYNRTLRHIQTNMQSANEADKAVLMKEEMQLLQKLARMKSTYQTAMSMPVEEVPPE